MTKYYNNYWKALREAERLHLKECVYGDWNDKISYCGWNKTGNMNDACEVEAYYAWKKEDGVMKPERITSPFVADFIRTEIGVETSFSSWKDIKDWAVENGYKHLADRLQLNNDNWASSGEFGRSQVEICDNLRFAATEDERHEIAKEYDKACASNYGLY